VVTLKNIIVQYFNYMGLNSESVMDSLNRYPMVLEIFTAFFRSLLLLGEICHSYDEILDMAQTY
jgi:hypothetical protein